VSGFDAKARGWDSIPGRSERACAVAEGIRRRVPFTPGLHALEYGCGTGLLSFALQPFPGRITLADSSPGMLAVLAEKIAAAGIANMTPLRLDLSADPPPAGRYDLIHTLMTLHHIPDTQAVLRAFFGMLAEPGWLCVADLDREDGSFHNSDFSGHRGFDRGDLETACAQIGFRKIAFDTVYLTVRETAAGRKVYPVFLMTARRE
jgi:ubiquinone/menaquinone biosynthesis C-methylase UbiE